MIIFNPPMTEPFDWSITYSSPLLFDPLRESKIDHVAYSTLNFPEGASLSAFRVMFKFPRQARRVEVREEFDRGIVTLATTEEGGATAAWAKDGEVYRYYSFVLEADLEP